MSIDTSTHEETTQSLGEPARRVTQELASPFTDLPEAIAAERAAMQREVLLWQRWVRYAAIVALLVLSFAFGSIDTPALVPLAIIVVCYTSVVMSTAWLLRHPPARAIGRWVPTLIVASDITAIAGISFLTSEPRELHRILLLGFLSMQLAVFYFGRKLGTFAAALTIAIYLSLALVAPPFVAGPRPSVPTIAFNVALFGVVSAVLVQTFGRFRERMAALHVFCRVAERGEALPPLAPDRWPDELTLLATSFQEMHAHLAEQIGSDPLTGCMNRRALLTRLRADLRAARRRASTLAVVVIDVDHFKEINDSYGHPVGDLVLQQAASIMRTTARDTDAVARFGGDEFVIALPDTTWDGAMTFAERVRARVSECTFGSPDVAVGTTISVGVALAHGMDPVGPEMLLTDADTALYRAKTAGRNRVFS